ncbi:hypothetical protein ACX80W_14725 [Arthrobacter sp. TMN-37]
MSKPSILALSLAAVLLAGCSTPAASGSADRPSQRPSASPSDSPSATQKPTVAPKPTSKPTPAAAPTPEVAPPAPAPVAPQPAPFIPESPQPVVPVVPADPAVTAPPVNVPPALTHTSWVYPDVVPAPWPNFPSAERVAGTSWYIAGAGYPPGAEIRILFGEWGSDEDLLHAPVVKADANGHYRLQVHLSADFAPGTYGFMVWYKPFAEEGKRYAMVEVLPAGTPIPTPPR